MSGGIGGSEQSQSQTQNSQTNPWEPTQGYLKDFLAKLSTAGSAGAVGSGPTATQTSAIDELKSNADQGNPWAGKIGSVTDDLFSTTSRAPQVQQSFDAMKTQLSPYANGENLDFKTNPYVQDMLKTVGDDAANRVNGMFAGAGRDFSGEHARALGRGVASAEAPILASLYTDAQGKQLDASKTLFGGGTTAATTSQGLDKDALGTRAMGIDAAQAAIDAKNYGPNAKLALEESVKKMPFDQLGWIAQYLFPAAGLGQQSSGTATGNASKSQWGLSLKYSDLFGTPTK